MKDQSNLARLAKIITIVTFIIVALAFVGGALMVEYLQFGNPDAPLFGEDSLLGSTGRFSIFVIVLGVVVPFIGLLSGRYALSNLPSEDQSKLFIGALAGNTIVFIPIFLVLAYSIVNLLNETR